MQCILSVAVHRNVKPSNCLLSQEDPCTGNIRAMISDFAQAKPFKKGKKAMSKSISGVIGDWGWFGPEMAANDISMTLVSIC